VGRRLLPENFDGGGTSSLEVMVDVRATAAVASTCTVGVGDNRTVSLVVSVGVGIDPYLAGKDGVASRSRRSLFGIDVKVKFLSMWLMSLLEQ
jgi:hypothetical protein